MSQTRVWDFYNICKKKIDRLHAKKLKKNQDAINNLENRLTTKSNETDKLNGETRTKLTKNSNLLNRQPKLAIDSETRNIILKSNTIIDQTKSPTNQNYHRNSNLKADDFIFKKPLSPAPKAKRKLLLDQKSFTDSKINFKFNSPTDSKRFKSNSILLESQQTIQNCSNDNQSNENLSENQINSNECKVRKRLFDSNIDDVKEKLSKHSSDEFLNKLKNFQERSRNSFSSRFNVSFYSPSKKQQEELAKTQKDITNCSPSKYLENRLKNLSSSSKASPIKSSNLFLTENSPPKTSSSNDSTYPKLIRNLSNSPFKSPQKLITNLPNSPFKSPQRLGSSLSNSPFKSPQRLNASLTNSPFKSPSKLNHNYPFNSPIKSDGSPFKVPFNSPIKKSNNELSLPDKYCELAKAFGHLDAIVIYLVNHSKICTFDKVKFGVQKLINKEFDLKHLAQIIYIYPNAYTLNYDQINEQDTYLVIKPNVEPDELTKLKTQERYSTFKDNLYRFAKKVHTDYLLNLDRPIVLNSEQKLLRWHPSFIFPNIPEAKLPEQKLDNLSESDQTNVSDDDIEVIFDEPNDDN